MSYHEDDGELVGGEGAKKPAKKGKKKGKPKIQSEETLEMLMNVLKPQSSGGARIKKAKTAAADEG
jgi:hypothetical protein